MATVFKVSQDQWKKFGLSGSVYDKLVKNGWQPIWVLGGSIGFLKQSTGETVGFAKVKNEELTDVDVMFKDIYVVHGEAGIFLIDKAAAAAEPKSAYSPWASAPAPPPTKAPISGYAKVKTKAPKMAPSKIAEGKNLTTVDEVGVSVMGTDNYYKVYLLSDDCNLAYRFTGAGLSIRAEKISPEARKALKQWGVEVDKHTSDGRTYASIHLNIPTIEVARKTLGSLAGSLLSGPPTKMLAKDMVI